MPPPLKLASFEGSSLEANRLNVRLWLGFVSPSLEAGHSEIYQVVVE